MKKTILISIITVLLSLAANCFADAGDVLYTNKGLNMPIPADIAEQLEIEMPEESEEGILFTVSEKASREAAVSQGYSREGAGWLFSIAQVSEERYHEMICGYMTGAAVFAKDNAGMYYIYYHPTDVRLFRDKDAYNEANLKAWGELNSWAESMMAKIIDENGLTPEHFSDSEIGIHLARMFYRGDTNYTLSTTQYGPMAPHGVKASDYIEPLLTGAVYTPLNGQEAPDGEYVVLDFPGENIRFDFFFADGKDNYIRQVWFNGEHELLYKAEFQDKNTNAAEIMNTMYLDMVLANSLGYTTEDMVGTWAEKMAGRCSIEILRAAEADKFDVRIHWGSSAFETYVWSMTAEATGNGTELRYEDCKLTDLVFTSEDRNEETVKYENGKGSFLLLSTYELVWMDETEHAADDLLFVKAGD